MIAIEEGTAIKSRQRIKPNEAQASITSNNFLQSIKQNEVRTRNNVRAETRDDECVYMRDDVRVYMTVDKCVHMRNDVRDYMTVNVGADPSD